MDKLNEVQIFKTGSTIANGGQLTDVAVNKYKTAIDGLNLSQAQAALSTTALNEAQQKQILTSAGLITSTDSVTAAEVKQAVSENVLTTAKQQEVLAVFEQQMAEGQLSIERLQAIALENTEAGAVARVILAKKGENAQNLKNIASGKALNAVLKEQFLLLLKNPLTWVAVAVVGVVALTKAIENSIVTEEKLNEEIEELNSNWSELSSTIQNSAQSFQSLKKSADELIPRYAELAQGVDKYGNNVSLTDEEFEEFVSLNNQLGQMFPELVMGYDSNGNAILSLSGNVNTLTESLYSLVEAQRLASAQTIADTMPDVMSNIDSTVEAYKSQIELAENSMSDLDDLYNIFSNEGYVEAWSSVGESMIDAVKILDKYGIKYNSEITGERNGVVGSTKYKITVDWDDFETSYNGVIAGYEKKINDIENKIESKWKQLNPVVSAWLSTDYLYQDLESNGQSLVTAMVGAIDFKSLGLTTEQEVQNYISNSIISPIYDMDTATQNAFFKIFDLHEALDNGELSVQEYQKEINNILENGNYSQEFVTIFRMAFAEDDVQTKYNEAVTKFGTDSKDTLEKFFTDNSINTEEEIDYFNKVTEGAKTASEAIEMYNKVKSDTFNNETTISFEKVFNAETFEDSAKTLKELAISGEISPVVLTSTETYRKLLKDTGLTAEEAVEKIREIALGESTLADVMDEIKSLAGTIKDVENEMAKNGQVSFDTLQSIAKKYPSLEQYIRDYLNRVEGSYDNLVSQLNNLYQKDLNNYDDYYETKQANDEGWWYDYSNQYASTWIFSLANSYDCDLRNYKTYLEAKQEIGERLDVLKASKKKIQEGLDSGEIANSVMGTTSFDTLIPMLQQQKAEEAAQEMLDYTSEQISDLQKLYDGILQDFEDSIITSTDIFKDRDYASGTSSSSSDFDWIETKLSNVNEELDKLNTKAADVYSTWKERNDALDKSLSTTTNAIALQRQAYARYMQEANSIGLPSSYRTLIENGAIDISPLNGTTKEQVEEYKTWYEKAQDCLKTINELESSQKELASQKFDNIKSENDLNLATLTKQRDLLQTQIDLAEIKGLFVNENYYTDMIALTQNELVQLTEERKQLQAMIENTSFSQGSEEWNSMFSVILDVDSAIEDATNSIVGFNNAIRDTQWEIFDYLEESILRVTNEADFLVELFSNEKLTNESGLTSIGDATNALHLVSYQTYSKQAKDYLEEIQDLQKQLIQGDVGTDVLNRYYELIDARQDAILAAQDEKNAILDLVEEGYQSQLDSLNEIIAKKKESLNAEKDLYDYQKSVSESSKNISSLQKQYDMYKNDTSEEGIAKIQQIKVELEDAKADLKETEYEKYLSDQEQMLDSLSDEFETWINERLDNAEELFEQIANEINSNGNEISSVLNEISGKYGVSLGDTLCSIFDNSNLFDGTITAIDNLISSVRDMVSINSSTGINTTTPTNSSVVSNKTTSTTTTPSSNNSSSNNNFTATSSAWDWLIRKKDYYPKASLNKDTSVIDLLKYHDYDSSVTARSLYYKKLGGNGTFSNSAAQNEWLLKCFKANGYKKGTSFAKAGLSWTQEDGNEIIIRKSDGAVLTPLGLGDKVVNAEGSKNLFDFANNPQEFMNGLKLNVLEFNLPKIPDIKPSSAMVSAPTIDVGGVEIVCNEVQNAKELMEDVTNQLIKNDRFNKAMSTMVNNEIMGKNSLERLKYSR